MPAGFAEPVDWTTVCAEPPVAGVLRPLHALGQGKPASARVVGGKAALLARLLEAGYPVPSGCVLDARAFTAAVTTLLPAEHDLASLVRASGSSLVTAERAARARERLLGERLAPSLREALAALWERAGSASPWGLAVRSSATTEDGVELSMAGLAESVVGAMGPEALEDAVRAVWASAFLPRTLSYLARAVARGVRLPRDLAMAVVIQRVVVAESAGVLFTRPPRGLAGPGWPEGARAVTATWGLGGPVADGTVPVDRFVLDAPGAVLSQAVAPKAAARVVEAGRLVDRPVDLGRQTAPALEPVTLGELARLASALERGAGWTKGAGLTGPLAASKKGGVRALDVELAVERVRGAPTVALLQVRPITSSELPEGGDEDTVWSRANVGEALPGAATPLTWSVARRFSDRGFRDAFAALGCTVDKDARLVGSVDGRIYLNLTAFVRIAAQVPGLSPRALLGAGGGVSEAALALLEQQTTDVSWRAFLLRAPLRLPSVVSEQLALPARVESFEPEAERARQRLFDVDLSILPDDALATSLRDAAAFLERTGSLMLSAASASLAAHLALVAFLRLSLPAGTLGRAENVAQTLTQGGLEVDSAEPGLALVRLAEAIRLDPACQHAIQHDGVKNPSGLPPGPGRASVEDFLARFGDRCIKEAELAQPRWGEDAAPVFAMLRAALRSPSQDPARALERARAVADRELADLEAPLGRVRMEAVRVLVRRDRLHARLRERMRTWVTRALGLVRHVALEVDRRLRRIDPSLEPGAVFFCAQEELVAALRSGRAELGPVVRLRRASFARDAARPEPPPSFVGYPPRVKLPPVDGARLVGLAASAGVVEGVVRVLAPGPDGSFADDSLSAGEILVARTTDVGLTPLFLVAAGVITELGGPLSHAAIVAREYGVPAVVSVADATSVLRTGERVRVDGERGVVERLG
jgi:phosphohistidine swiveling domain-containing protein